MKKLFLVGLLAVAAANATITPDLMVSSPSGPFCTAGPDTNCTYSYEAYLPEKHYLDAGDYFTIYDFAGWVEGSAIGAPANWSGSAQYTGVDTTTPVVTIPDDDAVYNITWTYGGPRIDAPASGITFTGFTAVSELNGIATGWYAAQTHKNTGTAPGTGDQPDANGGLVDVPGPDQGSENPVPEPMSMMLIGGGLSAIGMLRLRKK